VNALPRPPSALALLLAAATVAGLLGWMAVHVNLKRGCTTQDTPYLDLCQRPDAGSAADVADLRARIAANPGDANAYVLLALASRDFPDATPLRVAAQVAPHQPSVLMLEAAAALNHGDWAQAVPPLVQLVEHRENRTAAQILAGLVAGGQGALLAPSVAPGTHWLPRVLWEMPQTHASVSVALPLVVRGLKAGVLGTDAIRNYTRALKGAGAWTDAYSLWLALQGHALPVLFNAGFDDPFQPDGFDWEVVPGGPPSRAGALIERKGAEERGAVLEVRFTGRALPVPMVRQYLFLGPGTYRLRGEYMSRQLRIDQGLAWTVQCTSAKAPAGRSAPLMDTGGQWQRFTFDLTVPPACGAAASLQLETQSPSEAALGARGRVAFDAFSLEKLAP
jgi:hypothetical protein